MQDLVSIFTAAGNQNEAFDRRSREDQVTIVPLTIERYCAIFVFIEVTVKLLGWRRQEREVKLGRHPQTSAEAG